MTEFLSVGFAPIMLVLGLLVGSFANVVIWRVPRGESVVSPGSRCPSCQTPVAWHDNVPVISWVLLRGRCRSCSGPIARRYPLVEALSGGLWLAAALWSDSIPRAFATAFLFWMLLVLTFIDLDTMRLPNPLVGIAFAGGVLGVLVAQVTGTPLVPLVGTATSGPLSSPAITAVIGLLLGAGVSGGIAAAYAATRGRSGFGMGDVKLLGAMGLFLGPFVLLALMIGSLAGAVYGVVSATRASAGLAHKIPFGPFLAIGGVVTVLFGEPLVGAYLRAIGM